MYRQVTSHRINGLNEQIRIKVMDEPGSGNANLIYELVTTEKSTGLDRFLTIQFHHGNVADVGVKGISNEALLAVVEDRLKGFQSGEFACRENALALTHLQEAMHWLHHRTHDRLQRGVEGVPIR